MTKYRVTVHFSGTCEYVIEIPDDVESVEDELNELLYEFGSFDNITNRVSDCIEEEIIDIAKVEVKPFVPATVPR